MFVSILEGNGASLFPPYAGVPLLKRGRIRFDGSQS